MKKTFLLVAALGLTLSGFAQEKYVVSASLALKEHKLDEAKTNIDKAMMGEKTKNKPKTLFVKAETYMSMQRVPKYKSSNPYKEGTQALLKLVQVKPDYEEETVNSFLLYGAFNYYNDGVTAYNAKKYKDAIEDMKNVIQIHNIEGGKRFSNNDRFDTIAAEANQTIAMSTQNQGNYKDAIPLLTAAKNNPITKSAAIYESLIYCYNQLKDTKNTLAAIKEARAAFPDNITIRNYELNYFISSGKQAELAKKLEEAAVKEPNNPDIQFNIATTYLSMAFPKSGPKPANAAELIAKSEAAFQKAIQLSPDNATYNYNFGALYYNEATEVNDQMNAITGSSDADMKKYNGLKTKRDGLFGKALPYFEKAYNVLLANESKLDAADKNTFKSTILALKEIYARQNKMDKSAAMKKKYQSL